MKIEYNRVNWQNYKRGQAPQVGTPLNAENLNIMDEGIKKATDGVNELFDYIEAGGGGTGGELPADVVRSEVETPFASNDHIICGVENTKNKIYDSGVSISSLQPKLTAGEGINIVDNVIGTNLVVDHGSSAFTITNTEVFSMLHQHIYQIGGMVFVHLVFRTNKAIETTGLFTLGQLNISPMHTHSFTVVPVNPGASKEKRIDCGYITSDGLIQLDVTQTYSSKNYTFDITTFYCTDIVTVINNE